MSPAVTTGIRWEGMLSLSGITAVHGIAFVVHRVYKTYVLSAMPGVMGGSEPTNTMNPELLPVLGASLSSQRHEAYGRNRADHELSATLLPEDQVLRFPCNPYRDRYSPSLA